SRSRPRRRLRLSRGEAADEACARTPLARQDPRSAVTLALSEISTPTASFRDDLRAYAAAGFDGLGIWESKLGDDDADLASLRESGLRATNCVPLVSSILPNTVIEGPDDVDERVEAMCVSLRRLARYEPDCVLCLTGAAGERS